MRKLKIIEHISLDGVISPGAPGEYGDDYANGGWTAPYRRPAGAAAIAEAQGTGFDLLLGRRTYDLWADFWPKVKGGPFADGLNAARKYVATHRPESLGWGPVGDLGTDVMAGIRRDCEAKWRGNYEMRDYCEKEQITAYQKINSH